MEDQRVVCEGPIPHYWPQMKAHGLPAIQYSNTGALREISIPKVRFEDPNPVFETTITGKDR